MNRHKISRVDIPVVFFMFLTLVILYGSGCSKSESKELYHKFPDKVWARFNYLSFEIPVNDVENPYNIYLFARFSRDFQYEKLDFNMDMNTSAGEERIHEYQMDVKSKSGSFLCECKNDSCEQTIMLKKELRLTKPGILKIEIENLTPRMRTEGVLGVGIRIVKSGK